jgi:adenylate cyclase
MLAMRALIARARGYQVAFRDYAEGYRTRAVSLGFTGHIAIAEETLSAPTSARAETDAWM